MYFKKDMIYDEKDLSSYPPDLLKHFTAIVGAKIDRKRKFKEKEIKPEIKQLKCIRDCVIEYNIRTFKMDDKIVKRMWKALLNAQRYQGVMGSYMSKLKILVEDKIDLSEVNIDKETFIEELAVVETTDGFCFVFEDQEDVTKAPYNIPVIHIIEYLEEHKKISYENFKNIGR